MSLAVLADHMASKGRGPDSMLIHMSPREVQGLQSLAMAHGGSLTVNPETGLPEAGFLDKLLPTIIGAGLSFIPGVGPLMAAGIVGGIQTVRTGDIGKGLAAGLGAYGGAGLAQGLATAGTGALSAEVGGEALKAAGLTGEAALTAEADQIAQRAIEEKLTTASPFDKLSAGASQAVSSPQAAGAFLKDNAKNLMYAAGPAILAGANVQSKGPQTITKPGMIRPYSFDPYGGTYTAGTPYEAMPTRGAEGGLMSMAAGGIAGYGDGDDVPRQNGMAQGGMYDFAQRSEPVVRMAEGGVPGYAIGGETKAAIDAAYAAGDYAKVNELAQENKITAADVASTYQGFDTSGLAGLGINLFTPSAAPTYTQYSDAQIGSYLSNPANQNIDINKAIVDTNADPAAVNRYIASLANPFVGSTDITGGSGVLGIYNQMIAQGIDPNELYAAEIANDPKYAGYTQPMIQKAYDLSKGAYALSDQLKGVVGDKDWVKFMDDNKYSIDDAAQAFGLSRNEVKSRYDAVKAAEKKVVTPITTVTGGTGNDILKGTTIIPGVNDYGLGGTGTSGRLESIYGPSLPPGVSGAGITTVNPNGTITTRPNIPGIPEGGFTGMANLRDVYEKGGGSLGVNKNLFAPTTTKQIEDRYKLTGGSKAAYDYLMGRTPYDPTPATKTGEIMKPYFESVGRFPENRKAKKYVFVDGKYQLNPDYVKPSYVLAGEKAAALTNQDKEPTESPGAGNKWTWNSTDKKWEATPISTVAADTNTQQESTGLAGGGLMAMARGGMSQQFNLGDYSDGGRLLRGPGDGVSDSIPATIGGKRPARLADGEFVVPARIVSELGNGSTEAGARKLYAMMDRIQKARRGTVGKGRVAKNSRSDKYLPA